MKSLRLAVALKLRDSDKASRSSVRESLLPPHTKSFLKDIVAVDQSWAPARIASGLPAKNHLQEYPEVTTRGGDPSALLLDFQGVLCSFYYADKVSRWI